MGSQPGQLGGVYTTQFSSPRHEWSLHTSNEDWHDLYAVKKEKNIVLKFKNTEKKLLFVTACSKSFTVQYVVMWNRLLTY